MGAILDSIFLNSDLSDLNVNNSKEFDNTFSDVFNSKYINISNEAKQKMSEYLSKGYFEINSTEEGVSFRVLELTDKGIPKA